MCEKSSECLQKKIESDIQQATSDTIKYYVPIWEKANLTIKEAAAYSGIGEHTIRELIADESSHFAFKIGNKQMINRKLFDQYVRDICTQ